MYSMERRVNQIVWAYFMKDVDEDVRFENDTYIIKPYDWSNKDDNVWNFYHKPSGLKVQWYKYPLRSPYSNMEITNEQWWDVLADCYNSTSDLITYDHNKWWENGFLDDKLIRATLSEYAPIEVLADYVLNNKKQDWSDNNGHD